VARNGFGGTIALELDLRSYMADGGAVREVLVRQRELCRDFLRVRA
jgi:hypothetical protein